VRSRRTLVGISAVQLAVGVLGQVVAHRRRLNYDVLFPPMRGRPEHVGRDSVLFGTALSAPVTMLATQAACTARLSRSEDPRAARTLGALGAAMSAGYLVERTGRAALTPRGADPVVTPIVIAGTGLAAAMAWAGLRMPSAR
jgi:hypothetical protein